MQRIPPVLGYDVETNLEPKWRYLTDELHLTTYDITRFPAYFSYPLDTIIIPRTKYLKDKVGVNFLVHYYQTYRFLTL